MDGMTPEELTVAALTIASTSGITFEQAHAAMLESSGLLAEVDRLTERLDAVRALAKEWDRQADTAGIGFIADQSAAVARAAARTLWRALGEA